MLADIFRMLVLCLGNPVQEFNWKYEDASGKIIERKNLTPQQYYKEIVEKTGVSLRDYVMMMNDPSKDYYKLYEIENYRNRYDGTNWTFVNLPNEELKKYAKASILADEPLYFSCDVDKQLNSEAGLLSLNNYDYESVFGVKFTMNKKERILTFDSGSSHGMALIGIDTTETGSAVKWLLENSWGKDAGHNGFLSMTDDWFDEYAFRLVIHKSFINSKALKVLEQKAILLPPWDPMN